MKTGLVLEGGAMRGMYTAGMLDVFLDNQITYDGVIGVSAGAITALSFLSGQKGRTIRYSKKYNGDKRYMSVGSLIRTGNFINTDFAYDYMPRNLDVYDDAAFQANGVPFYAVVTNVDTGHAEYLPIERAFDQMDVLRASASMPFVSRPVEIDGRRYLDGGVADPIPYEAMQELGYDRLVVILTQDIDYRKEPMNQALINLFYHKNKAFAEALKKRHLVYNRSVERLRELEKAGTIFVIRPEHALNISRLEKDPAELQRVYDVGVREAKIVLPEIEAYLRG